MNKAVLDWVLPGGNSVTAEYQAVLDRATTLGYSKPTAAQQVKQNTLVTALKAAGVWTSLDVFYVFATNGDQNFATLNWISPSSNQITRGGTVTFTADQGYNGNGTTGYLDTNWTPSTGTKYLLDDASSFCHIYNAVTEAKYDYGSAPNFIGGGGKSHFRCDDGFGGYSTSINATNSMSFTTANMTGLWHTQRKDSANAYLFRNGSQVDTDPDASDARPTIDMFLLAFNSAGSASGFSTKKMSCFGAGASLNGLESATYTAWNTYLTSL